LISVDHTILVLSLDVTVFIRSGYPEGALS
jgi:hypothetical protein